MTTVSAQSFLNGAPPPPALGNESHPKSLSAVPSMAGGIFGKVKSVAGNIVDKTAASLNERTDSFSAIDQAGKTGQQSKVETGVQKFGQGVNLATDVAFNILSSITPDVVKDPVKKAAVAAINTPIGKLAVQKLGEGMEAYDAWKAENPEHERIARDIDALVSIGSTLPVGEGGVLGGKGAKKAVEVAAEQAGKITKGAAEVASKGLEAAGSVVEPAIEIAGDVGRGIKKRGANLIEDAQNDVAIKKTLKDKGKSAIDVYDESGSPEFINVIDNTKSKEDLLAKKKMLDVAGERLKGSASSKLPRSVVADDYIIPRVETLRSRLEEVGKVIGDAEKGTNKFQRVDARDVYENMVQEARKLGVNVSQERPGGELVFSKANGVGGIDQARVSAIKTMFEGFTPSKTGSVVTSPAKLAQTRRNLSALTKRTDAAKEVVAAGGPIDNTRRFIAQKLGDDYYNATKEYSDIARVLGELDPDSKVRLSDDALDEIRNIKVSDLSRRLLSNNATQAKSVFRSLDELYAKEAARLGKDVPKQDLEDLVDFAGAIEEGFGITPRNTFFGQTKGGVSEALMNNLTSPVSAVVNILTKPKRDDKRALEAMKKYIDEALSR